MRVLRKTNDIADIEEAIKNKRTFIAGLLYINKNDLVPRAIDLIKNNLTFEDDGFGESIVHVNYYEYQDYIIIPKYYTSIFGDLEIDVSVEFINQPKSIDIYCDFAPRNKAQLEVIDTIKNNPTIILKAPPGFGKTYVAIKTISDLKKKALIIVDSEKLAKQWKADLLKFTNLQESDINIIQGSQEIHSRKLDAPIIISLIQTLSSAMKNTVFPSNEKFRIISSAGFGIIVIDEIHKSFGSPEFSKTATLFTTESLLGLSATPKKSSIEGTNVLLSYFENKIITPNYEKKSKIHLQVIRFNSKIPPKSLNYIMWGGKWNDVRYRKLLLKSKEYLNLVLTVANILKKKEKHIIFLAHEIIYLDTISKMLIDNGWDRSEIGIIKSGVNESELEKQFIFGTYKMLTAALSINTMNTLVYLTPPGASGTTIEQSSGRIDRDHTDGETKRLVIDLVDEVHHQIRNRIYPRMREYLRLNIIPEYEFVSTYLNDETLLNLGDITSLVEFTKRKYNL